uniref:Uncharacterized protein n=1 Tax=Romanomermis culicivorax TaxID=13658 RepID=A0A915ITP5_ROMCU
MIGIVLKATQDYNALELHKKSTVNVSGSHYENTTPEIDPYEHLSQHTFKRFNQLG